MSYIWSLRRKHITPELNIFPTNAKYFQLLLHVDPAALPPDLGGSLDYDHLTWLNKCNQVAEHQVGYFILLHPMFVD